MFMDEINDAVKYILESLDENVYSIYVKGSFVMQEMLPTSDIDLVVIYRETAREAFNKIKGHEVRGSVSISGFSLDELRSGERKFGEGESPKSFMRFVKYYKLLHGKSVLGKFPMQSDEKALMGHKHFLKNSFIPGMERGDVPKDLLPKQILWMSFNELKVKGKNPDYSFKSINELLPQDHIGKRAYKMRMGKEDKSFFEDVKKYLESSS